ncbi:hypothetical protein ACIQ6R_16145 [Streptomyces sp. NPDC096048]|uniref:hypothetical protein n=1 Tax=Streptomyces sp. NPDC096048 TaxID=3366072 RepID=UPI0038160B47
MPDTTAIEQLRDALADAEVLTRPAELTDNQIDHLTGLAHEAHVELHENRIPH